MEVCNKVVVATLSHNNNNLQVLQCYHRHLSNVLIMPLHSNMEIFSRPLFTCSNNIHQNNSNGNKIGQFMQTCGLRSILLPYKDNSHNHWFMAILDSLSKGNRQVPCGCLVLVHSGVRSFLLQPLIICRSSSLCNSSR